MLRTSSSVRKKEEGNSCEEVLNEKGHQVGRMTDSLFNSRIVLFALGKKGQQYFYTP